MPETAAPAPAAAPSRPGWRRHAVPVLILWTIAVLAYANSFRGGLIYDSQFIVKQDARIRQASSENLSLIFHTGYWYKTSLTSLYRPLVTLTYLFNYAILGEGDAPAGYHAVNLALHLANITLVYLLGWLVLAEFWPAFAMAALWGVHPALTESVTNVVGRADLLAAFGVLAGLLCYVRSLRSDGLRAILWQAGILAASAIAMFSKENGIVILAALFLYDIGWRPRAPLRARIAGYAAAILPILVFLDMRAAVLKTMPVSYIPFTDNPLAGADFLVSRLTAVKVLGRYLWLLLWPAKLSCDYSYNQIPLSSFGDWRALLSLAVLAGGAVFALRRMRRQPAVFFLIGFFFAAMAPTANVFFLIGTIMAERVLYLPAVGVAGLAAWAGWELYRKIEPGRPWVGTAAVAVLAAVCLTLGARTFLRNFDWYDERSLWTSAENASPASYRTYQHVANALANEKKFDAAEREIQHSLAILRPLSDEQKPALVYATAGFVLRTRGDAAGGQEAQEWYRKALDVLLEGVRVDDAGNNRFQLENRLAGKQAGPSHAVPFYLELARTYRSLGRYQDSLNAVAAAGWADPQAEFFEEISKTYQAMHDDRQAAVALLEGIAMAVPDQVRLASEVVDLYKRTAPDTCALSGGGAGAAINFSCPLVHEELCFASRNAAILYHNAHRDNDAAAMVNGAVTSLGCPAAMFR